MSTIRDVVVLVVFSGVVGLCSIVFSRFWQDSVSSLPSSSLEKDHIDQFPGFFRNDMEEELFELEWYKVQPKLHVRNTPTFPKQSFDKKDSEWNTIADGRCPTISPFNVHQKPCCQRGVLNSTHYTYNVCCRSNTVFKPYKFLPLAVPGLSGDVEVAQFSNYKQYFSIQECCQMPGCNECKCTQTDYVVTAVVKMKGKYRVEWVLVPGCCQCLNY